MNWAQELPQVDGWYWWRRRDGTTEVVHLDRDYIRTTEDGAMVDTIFFKFFGGEFLGPLSPDQLLNLGRV